MVDLRMTEFWYSGKPDELAEYRRLKEKAEVDRKASDIVDEVSRKSRFKTNKRPRKRRNIFGKKRKLK